LGLSRSAAPRDGSAGPVIVATQGSGLAARGHAANGLGGGMMGGVPHAPVPVLSKPTLRFGRALNQAAQANPAKVRQIGTKTFYFKNNRWVDSTVTPEEDSKASVIVQLSDAYFVLASSQKSECNQYLSLPEPVTVKLDGTVYQIDPAKQEPAH
jgi:Ca-activated chloride channel homolog